MAEDELWVRYWIEIIKELYSSISKRGHLCPIMHMCIKNIQQYKCKMRGKENMVYLNPIVGHSPTEWDAGKVEEETLEAPDVLNLFPIELWIPVNGYINPFLVGFSIRIL